MEKGVAVQEETSGFMKILHENWQFLAFIVGGIAAYITGRERTRWKVHDVGDSVAKMDERIAKLERINAQQSVQLAAIDAHLQHLLGKVGK